GRLVSGPAYAEAWRWVHRQSRRLATLWDTFDLLLTPTVTTPPVPLGTFKSPADDPLAGIFRAADFAPFTAVFNATGQPACSLPRAIASRRALWSVRNARSALTKYCTHAITARAVDVVTEREASVNWNWRPSELVTSSVTRPTASTPASAFLVSMSAATWKL